MVSTQIDGRKMRGERTDIDRLALLLQKTQIVYRGHSSSDVPTRYFLRCSAVNKVDREEELRRNTHCPATRYKVLQPAEADNQPDASYLQLQTKKIPLEFSSDFILSWTASFKRRDRRRGECFVTSLKGITVRLAGTAMAFTFAAFCYMLTLVLCAALIFFVIWQIIAFDELRTDFKNPIDQSNPTRARERILNIERICNLLRRLVVPEYSIHGLFCLMFMCAGEWVTLGLNIPLLLYHLWRFFHRPADGSEVMYDPVSVMNADILNYCQKESWCKLGFYLLSFFYYLYSMVYALVSF
ncbi:hypothetical protein G5714_010877 [Onychostoma macrolepis]|nr:hypothetical protein G5714_010877 [Onychostoma macrolepis]